MQRRFWNPFVATWNDLMTRTNETTMLLKSPTSSLWQTFLTKLAPSMVDHNLVWSLIEFGHQKCTWRILQWQPQKTKQKLEQPTSVFKQTSLKMAPTATCRQSLEILFIMGYDYFRSFRSIWGNSTLNERTELPGLKRQAPLRDLLRGKYDGPEKRRFRWPIDWSWILTVTHSF